MCPQLLSKPKFSGVEKIKTIGSTYMAATGLNVTPGPECAQACFKTHAYILTYMQTWQDPTVTQHWMVPLRVTQSSTAEVTAFAIRIHTAKQRLKSPMTTFQSAKGLAAL